MAKTKHDPDAVEAYLRSLPPDERRALEDLRQMVRDNVPDVRERISYGSTVIFATDRDLVGLASQPNPLPTALVEKILAARVEEQRTT